VVVDSLSKGLNKLDYAYQNKEMKMGAEKKTVVLLGALEALIVNDKNLQMALESDVLRILVRVL